MSTTTKTREAIRFRCGTCDYKIKIATKYAGKKGKCPSCKSVVRVPEAGGEPGYKRVARARSAGERTKKVARKVARKVSGAQKVADTKDCPECGEEIKAVAKKCRHCGEFFDAALKKRQRSGSSGGEAPNHVNLTFTVCGYVIFAFGLLGVLSALAAIVLTGGKALIPGLMRGMMSFVVARVGWGLKDRNKVAWIVSMIFGALAVVVNVGLMILILGAAGSKGLIGVAIMGVSLVIALVVYGLPAYFGIKHHSEIDWA